MFPHYSPITNTKEVNLLPIVFPAFASLGFGAEAKRQLIDDYINRYEIKDLNSVYFVANDFENHYLKRLLSFRSGLESSSANEILVDYLKDKKRSMSSCDFWALTRIGSAYEEGDAERIVQAIAFYDCIAKELKIAAGKVVEADARKEFIALMQKRRHFRGLSMAKTTEDKIRVIIQNQDSLIELGEIADLEETERVMLETFVEWYLMTEDRYVRSVLIGFHALYRMRDILPNYQDWLQQFWLQAEVASLMTRRSILWKKVEIRPWKVLEEQVLSLQNIEDIYFFYSLKDLYQSINLSLLRRVAQSVIDNQV